MTDKANLTTGSVAARLFQLAGPMVFGLAAVLSQSLVDAFFVGKLGTNQLAALSFTFPVALTFTSLAIGLSAGSSSVVSRVIGQGGKDEAQALATHSLLLSTLIVVALSLLGLITIEPLFALLGASSEVMPIILRYMPIWYASMPFLVVGIVGHGIMRANGEGRWPSAIMVVSALVNVTLTPALMVGWWIFPELNIEGVALATLIARVLNLAATLAVLFFTLRVVQFQLPSVSLLAAGTGRILKVAVPAGAGNVVNPLGIGVVTALLAVYGEATVAAFGVATRLEALACLPMLALSAAIGPFAGQNWGAGRVDRVIAALRLSYGACFATCAVLVVLFWTAGASLTSLFASEPLVAKQAQSYLFIVALSLWGYGLVIITASAFNGLGKSLSGFGYYALRMVVFYVPLSWIATLIAEQQAVFIAIAASNALAGIIAAVSALWWLRGQQQ